MSAQPVSFWQKVLEYVNALPTANNISILQKWQPFEGGNAAFNPLNTTQKEPGSTEYNSAGVQNYPSQAVGEIATAKTLINGYYAHILLALRTDISINDWSKYPIPEEVDTWGTHGFATYLRSLSPTPIPVEEISMVLCTVPNVGIWLLFVYAGRYVHVSDPTDVAPWVTAGAKEITIDAAQHAELLVAFPNSVPAT